MELPLFLRVTNLHRPMKKLSDVYTGTIYADEKVLASAPKHKRVGELEFFNLGRYATCAEVEAEYAKRGLVPAEVLALAFPGTSFILRGVKSNQ